MSKVTSTHIGDVGLAAQAFSIAVSDTASVTTAQVELLESILTFHREHADRIDSIEFGKDEETQVYYADVYYKPYR